jgi:hypothetical protein
MRLLLTCVKRSTELNENRSVSCYTVRALMNKFLSTVIEQDRVRSDAITDELAAHGSLRQPQQLRCPTIYIRMMTHGIIRENSSPLMTLIRPGYKSECPRRQGS